MEEELNIAFLDVIMGSYFGEIELIRNIPRLFSVISSENSEFLMLSKQIFETYVFEDYP